MMRAVLCLLLVFLVSETSGKCFNKCDLYDLMKELDGYFGYSGAQWVCLADQLSSCCSESIVRRQRAYYYGMFRISSDWCNPNSGFNPYWCGTTCSNLVNEDLTGDIRCIKNMVRSGGIDARTFREQGCAKKNADSYIEGCKGN